jgi:tRNA(Ile)-lysidine synthase
VFLLRPLLDLRRAELRAYLRSLGESWIEDPANDDPRYARSLARRQIAAATAPQCLAHDPPHRRGRAGKGPPPTAAYLGEVQEDAGGGLTLPRAAFRDPGAARLLGALALCAAGTHRPPATSSLARLIERLAARAPVTATLAGARIEAQGEQVLVCREAGEGARGGLAAYNAPPGESVFDGRFLIQAETPGWRIAALAGLARQLPDKARAALRALAPPVRAALPAAISPAGDITCPALPETGPVRAFPLGRARLAATLGAVRDEAALWRVAKPHAPT